MLVNMSQLFSNYQGSRLPVADPDFTNWLALVLFAVLAALSSKRDRSLPSDFLGVRQTEQLKGAAILLVVLGHLWTGVSQSGTWLVLSGDAVSLFLLLSGFGLTMSVRQRKPDFKAFFSRRIERVMVPYWIATGLVLLLDRVVLGKSLPLSGLIMTLFGINLSIELRHLDYVRWFVTFVLLWYVVFFIVITTFRGRASIFFVLGLWGFVLLPLNYYFLDFGWNQFFAFPVGYLLALERDKLEKVFQERRRACILVSLAGITWVLACKFVIGSDGTLVLGSERIPGLVLVYLREVNGLVLGLATLVLFGHLCEAGFESPLLHFLGKYSYEIFLLHGAFLVKYNPIIRDSGSLAVVGEFALFLLCVAALSFLLARVSALTWAKCAV
jgi:membrane-bound acyltransferase YfiQ involved in biofilm formation